MIANNTKNLAASALALAFIGLTATQAHAIAIFETIPVAEVVEQLEKIKIKEAATYRSLDDEIFFYEGKNCTETVVGSAPYDAGDGRTQHIPAKERSWMKNDEARSMLIKGLRKGAVIAVYDDPEGRSGGDDFSVIQIKADAKDKGVCIGNFEQSFRSKDGAWEVVHFHKNGLDGKVSHVVVSPKFNEDAYPADIFFYEGNNCTQDIKAKLRSYSSHDINCKKSNNCDNDEIRSVLLMSYGKSRYTLKVFDHPDGKQNDDWSVLKVDTTKFVGSQCVKTFEKDRNLQGVEVDFHKDNGLDGKISRIEVDS